MTPRQTTMEAKKLIRKLDEVLRRLTHVEDLLTRQTERLVTIREAESILGYSRRQIDRLISQGKLGAVKHGGKKFIPQSELTRYTTEVLTGAPDA